MNSTMFNSSGLEIQVVFIDADQLYFVNDIEITSHVIIDFTKYHQRGLWSSAIILNDGTFGSGSTTVGIMPQKIRMN